MLGSTWITEDLQEYLGKLGDFEHRLDSEAGGVHDKLHLLASNMLL